LLGTRSGVAARLATCRDAVGAAPLTAVFVTLVAPLAALAEAFAATLAAGFATPRVLSAPAFVAFVAFVAVLTCFAFVTAFAAAFGFVATGRGVVAFTGFAAD
jgi:hypothetical protein